MCSDADLERLGRLIWCKLRKVGLGRQAASSAMILRSSDSSLAPALFAFLLVQIRPHPSPRRGEGDDLSPRPGYGKRTAFLPPRPDGERVPVGRVRGLLPAQHSQFRPHSATPARQTFHQPSPGAAFHNSAIMLPGPSIVQPARRAAGPK